MSRLLLLAVAAAMLAAAPAVANLGPERAAAPAVEAPAPEWTGGQCLAVPAECGSGSAANILLLANSCTSDCNSEKQTCYNNCDSNANIWACRNTCDTDYDSCTASC